MELGLGEVAAGRSAWCPDLPPVCGALRLVRHSKSAPVSPKKPSMGAPGFIFGKASARTAGRPTAADEADRLRRDTIPVESFRRARVTIS